MITSISKGQYKPYITSTKRLTSRTEDLPLQTFPPKEGAFATQVSMSSNRETQQGLRGGAERTPITQTAIRGTARI